MNEDIVDDIYVNALLEENSQLKADNQRLQTQWTAMKDELKLTQAKLERINAIQRSGGGLTMKTDGLLCSNTDCHYNDDSYAFNCSKGEEPAFLTTCDGKRPIRVERISELESENQRLNQFVQDCGTTCWPCTACGYAMTSKGCVHCEIAKLKAELKRYRKVVAGQSILRQYEHKRADRAVKEMISRSASNARLAISIRRLEAELMASNTDLAKLEVKFDELKDDICVRAPVVEFVYSNHERIINLIGSRVFDIIKPKHGNKYRFRVILESEEEGGISEV